jgi:Tol biopolymer transport system component/DNA-binding winged helix-turn-helix (wHTH) protein
MGDEGSAEQRIQFGVFELDLRLGELRKQGVRIKVQEQPFKVLAALLERPGEVVTREELRRRIWPRDSSGDFDHAINIAVAKLRTALCDSADAPRLIETLHRRGYRFIFPLADTSWKADNLAVITPAPAKDKKETPRDEIVLENSSLQRLKARRVGPRYAAVLAAALGLIVGVLLWRHLSQNASRSDALLMTPLPFTSFPGVEADPSFSPNGNQIAFSWNGDKEGNFDIYVKTIGAEKPLRLTSSGGLDRQPVWSPDGRLIAFQRHSQSEDGIFTVPVLGGRERKLRSLRLGVYWDEGGFDWSPDGKSLVFSDSPPGQDGWGISLLSIEHPENNYSLTLPTAAQLNDYYPRFSPDGQRVAFIRTLTKASSMDIYLVKVAGGEPRRLTFDKASIHGLTWTPDGQYIVFSSDRIGSRRLWKIPTSGADPEPLSVGQENAFEPALSRDGRGLAYSRVLVDMNIWRYAASNATGRRELPRKLIASTERDQAPNFSPDGKKIAFASRRSGSYEIWMCDGDGSNPVQLTTFSSSAEVGTPRWSPDGEQIAFDFEPEGNVDIYVLRIDEGRPVRLTTSSSDDQAPTWSRDGHWIYFSSDRSGNNQIWKMPALGGPAVQVTKGGGYSPAYESPDAKSLYYSKDFMASGVWKVPLSGGQETLVLDQPAGGFYGYWDLVDNGICYYNVGTKDIEFFEFATKHVRRVATPLEPPIRANPGFSVSPDHRWILFAQKDQSNADIMLVENFRW